MAAEAGGDMAVLDVLLALAQSRRSGDVQRLTLGDVRRAFFLRHQLSRPTSPEEARVQRQAPLPSHGNQGGGLQETGARTECHAEWQCVNDETVDGHTHSVLKDESKDSHSWQTDESAWHDDMETYYREAIWSVERYNYLGRDCFAFDAGPGELSAVGKAWILSHVEQRRASAGWMVRCAGFRNVAFPETMPYENVDLEGLMAAGDVADGFMQVQTETNKRKYAAHALDYLHTIEKALEARSRVTLSMKNHEDAD